jgi:hypothetical protein
MIINLVLDRCFTSPLSASEKSGPDGGISSLSRCHARPTPAKMRFSGDSPLEGDGFEPSVPARKSRFLLRKANCSAAIWMGRPALCLHGSAPAVTGIDLSQLRSAIRETRKLAITYIDEEGRHTQSRIWPIAMA